MVTNFEQYTADVSDKELWIVELIAKRIRHNVGRKAQVTNAKIRKALSLDLKDGNGNVIRKGVKISEPKLRKYIQYIRQNNLVPMLCATQRGYYIAQTVQEFVEYIDTFEERINGMKYTLDAMRQQVDQHKQSA